MNTRHLDEPSAALDTYEAGCMTLPQETEAEDVGRALPPALVARYEDIRRIGEGSMGTVYRALDSRLGRLVALIRV